MAQPASIRRSLTRVVFLTTLIALLLNAVLLVVLDMREQLDSELSEARVQAEMLARSSAAAVAFSDEREAARILQLLGRNQSVQAAAIYRADGNVFAAYTAQGQYGPPGRAQASGMFLEGDRIAGFHSVQDEAGSASTVYLRTHSNVYDRLTRSIVILLGVMVVALAFTFLISGRLQRAVTAPVLAMADAARRVVQQRDYGVRVAKQPGYEVGLLADAFNHMLQELGQEIRERDQAEAALREADRRKDHFLATLAHELRNPLAPIVTSFQVLRRVGADTPAAAQAHKVVDRQIRHMTRLLDDLLDVARITNGKVVLQRSRVSLAAIVDSALESSRPLIDQAHHRLTVSLPDETVYLDADPVRVSQVFSNLLSNAARYTPPGGNIALHAAVKGAHVEVEVADDGKGIAEQDRARIFEIFAQSDVAPSEHSGGLGIGLFLVKAFTELHGGTVEVASPGVGRGSRFVVRLPIARSQGLELVKGKPDAQAATHARRILVADDNRDAAQTLATILELSGHEVRVAHDGAEALSVAALFHPHAGLIDIGMPGMDGYEVARRIRRESWGRDMLLVAITGWGSSKDRSQAFEAGFDHHLTKPARLEDIAPVLDTARPVRAAR